MDIHLLPAPIAYVRHLVDVEDDFRAKFDQLRVLAQNTLQVMAAVLLSDCVRLGLTGGLATQPAAKRLAVGDFATYVVEAADQLMPHIDASYIPELVQLYGEKSREARQRRDRLQQMVQSRNRDAHTASLAQSRSWLEGLLPEVDAVLDELDCLRTYTMVAIKNVEPAPDRVNSTLNGLRCQGFSEKYIPIKQTISQLVSRSEVVLIKVDRNDWLSLRPWFLYLWEDDGELGNEPDELGLLNVINSRHFNYIGLISGREYRVGDEWRSFTMYESETQGMPAGSIDNADAAGTALKDVDDAVPDELAHDVAQILLGRLTKCHENIVVKEQYGSGGKDYLVSVRTPAREVALAIVDELGEVQLFKNMLERAVGEGLLDRAKLESALSELENVAPLPGFSAALLDVGNVSERIDWLGTLARNFSD